MNTLKSRLNLSVKRPIAIFLRKLAEKRYKRGLTRQELEVPDKGIHLSYAGQSVQDANGIIHGGRVKLKHLVQEYPEKKLLTNLLYLVSRAIGQ